MLFFRRIWNAYSLFNDIRFTVLLVNANLRKLVESHLISPCGVGVMFCLKLGKNDEPR